MTPHIVVPHRWRDRYAEYARHLDHDRHAVTYVTTDVGVDSVPPNAAEVVVVPATDDLPAVLAEVRALATRWDPPTGVVALKEDDLMVAARLRAEWGCAGPTEAEVALFRDKPAMCRTVAAAGVDVPAFAPAESAADVVGFAGEHGWPVVLKPRSGSSNAVSMSVVGLSADPGFRWACRRNAARTGCTWAFRRCGLREAGPSRAWQRSWTQRRAVARTQTERALVGPLRRA
ncbi:acetyl-CoA carboxylase biotin carboxylase subunit family protein [Alloactinosynnema sp. L-07]|uniref:ATP-grasp domain-containing protein n=1 Tax=Alloactinosynnema sp. L-07 TaxID=1653480 RepID=UPI0012F71BB1|nr:hypothetical protein [Alloactinosynnema sp. L-07]